MKSLPDLMSFDCKSFVIADLRRLFQFERRLFRVKNTNLFCPAESSEKPNRQPIHIELIPFQTVSGRSRESVMIVVPAFAERQKRDKPVVSRIVLRFKRTFSENMGERIDKPGRVPTDHDAQKNAPQNH